MTRNSGGGGERKREKEREMKTRQPGRPRESRRDNITLRQGGDGESDRQCDKVTIRETDNMTTRQSGRQKESESDRQYEMKANGKTKKKKR